MHHNSQTSAQTKSWEYSDSRKICNEKRFFSLWRTLISRYDVVEHWWRIARAKPGWLDEWKLREFPVCHLWRTRTRH